MSDDELRAKASAVSGELIVVAGKADLREVRAAVVDSIIAERMFPLGSDATIAEAMTHAGIILRIITLTLGDALDELGEKE